MTKPLSPQNWNKKNKKENHEGKSPEKYKKPQKIEWQKSIQKLKTKNQLKHPKKCKKSKTQTYLKEPKKTMKQKNDKRKPKKKNFNFLNT